MSNFYRVTLIYFSIIFFANQVNGMQYDNSYGIPIPREWDDLPCLQREAGIAGLHDFDPQEHQDAGPDYDEIRSNPNRFRDASIDSDDETHVIVDSSDDETQNIQTIPTCRFFASKGGCKYGEKCKFQHVMNAPKSRNAHKPKYTNRANDTTSTFQCPIRYASWHTCNQYCEENMRLNSEHYNKGKELYKYDDNGQLNWINTSGNPNKKPPNERESRHSCGKKPSYTKKKQNKKNFSTLGIT